MRRAWKKLRYRLEHIGLLIAAGVVPLLPRPVVVGLAKISGALASLLDRYGRRIALANLDCAFGQNIRLQKNDVLFANRTSISLRPCSI